MFGFNKKNLGTVVDERRINKVVDYTCISPLMTQKELEKKLCVAYKNKYYSVCVNPINVKFASNYATVRLKGQVVVGTVVGFPLGETTIDVKVYEIKKGSTIYASFFVLLFYYSPNSALWNAVIVKSLSIFLKCSSTLTFASRVYS